MAEQEAVVRVRRSACERVTLRELFVGRLSFGSRLPQYLEKDGQYFSHQVLCMLFQIWAELGSSYLTTAMLTGAVVLAR